MKIKRYWEYFKYILEHKKYVFKECWKKGLYIHAFTHDLSKFNPVEFFPYADYFYGDKENSSYQLNFEYGWLYHQRKNKHHWDYWVDSKGKALSMPDKYIMQMICDWKAMSRKFGGTAQKYYYENINSFNLNCTTRVRLEFELGLIDSLCLVSGITWQDYCKKNNISLEDDYKFILVKM